MAENKQYIIQNQKGGSIMISEDVIGTIVAHAVSEVDGVVGLSNKMNPDFADLIGMGNRAKGVKITIDQDSNMSIDCNIVVAYGNCIVTVAKAAQDAIVTTVEALSGVKATAVNVNVCGVMRQ